MFCPFITYLYAMKIFPILFLICCSYVDMRAQKENNRSFLPTEYKAETMFTVSDGKTPLWLSANRYGLSSVSKNAGYLRAGVYRSLDADEHRDFRIGYGADVVGAYDFTSSFIIQQLYVDLRYKRVRLSIGSKERPAAMKNARLSSGSQTFGINARPVPEVRFELPEYWDIPSTNGWVAIKGHLGYGRMTDDNFLEKRAGNTASNYATGVLYHSKAGYLRLGNEEEFPLVFEGGLEMACLFGGTIYNPLSRDPSMAGKPLKMDSGIKAFWHALIGTGSDPTDMMYKNSSGNSLGSWLFSLSYRGKGWKVRAYYDHFFEDHSQMFFEYGWKDGLMGLELTLPQNPIASTLLYEFINTTYQSGPIYHDNTSAVPDQISAIDDYYNHGLYSGWQHWGQAMGNPFFTSPLYREDGIMKFIGNRFKVHHFGVQGNPWRGLHYRILYSYMSNWGTYQRPYDDVKYMNNFLLEGSYDFADGWSVSAAFGLDRGQQIGDNTGFQLTLKKSGRIF